MKKKVVYYGCLPKCEETTVEDYRILLDEITATAPLVKIIEKSDDSPMKRNGFNTIIREAKKGNIDVLCIYSYKELTSDVKERKEVCNELKKYGVEVYCIEKMLWQERAKKARMIKALMNKTSN